MANKDDYLNDYRKFFEHFKETLNPYDQLPVKLGSYKLINQEVVGGIIDWTTQYLNQKDCPKHLLAPLIKIVIEEIRSSCKKQPIACGFNSQDNAYEPLKLMQAVMAKTNEICLRYLDNSKLCSLPAPGPPYNITSFGAIRNTRRRMEDRHVIIDDLNTMFNIQEASPSSYYAIFDGHAGHDAAAYSAAHLHQFLAESKYYASQPDQALHDAFCKTDTLFVDKCKVESFHSGTTAVCALVRPKEKLLYVAWAGDSQAVLVSERQFLQIVNPHKPDRPDERERIENLGGQVLLWGIWRVNGQLAVSRAIGDMDHKPSVTAVPDIREINLSGKEDFLILACDGLWDFLSEAQATIIVYKLLIENSDDTDRISKHLIEQSKINGSSDNISVIVVFLREPSKIAAEALWANRNDTSHKMDTTLDNNPFANSNGASTDNNILPQKADGLLLNLQDNFKPNGGSEMNFTAQDDFFANLHENLEKANGKRSVASDCDDEHELGPETDIDAVDDVLMSPAIAASKALGDQITNNNPMEGGLAELEMHINQIKQQGMEFDGERSPREETPTPPADAVHDGIGLVENAADSGEESEDEWNYFKGDQEDDKENNQPEQSNKEVADQLESEMDNMSQLNPNAAEFVPISPTGSIPSPVHRRGLEDIISQSPMRSAQSENNDITVPNPMDFENEAKLRPGDVEENGKSDDDDELEKSTNDVKNMMSNGVTHGDSVDANITSTPSKHSLNEEFHFGPNAAPFTPAKLLDQSEAALSTKAVYGDESVATLGESILSVDNTDPMSTSFCQDREDDTNPFDLNKVQLLPENLDEFLSKPSESTLNDTLSDLPEHNPLEGLNNDEKIITTDLDKNTEEEKELASPLSQEEDFFKEVCKVPKKQSEFVDFLGEEPMQPKTALSPEPSPQPKISPEPTALSPSPQPELVNLSLSPQSFATPPVLPLSPQPIALSPSPQPIALSPSPEPTALSPVIVTCPGNEWISTEPALSPEPTGDICRLPGAVEKVISPEPVEEQQTEILECSLPVNVTSQFLTSDDRLKDEKLNIEEALTDVELKKEILDDITSSIKDDISSSLSPVDKIVEETFVALSESTLQEENINKDLSAASEILVQQDSFKSVTDTESVATADVNSFLDRSDIPEVASPLSPSNQPNFVDDISDPNHPLRRCVYPLPTQDFEIKTEHINQQFAEPAIVTPSEESKQDLTPTAPLLEEEKKDFVEVEEAVALTAVAVGAAAAVATAAIVEKKPAAKAKITATKKPPTKLNSSSPTKPTSRTTVAAKTSASSPKLSSKTATSTLSKTTKSTTNVPKPPVNKTTTLKPKTTTSATTRTMVGDKKPWANGDVKPAVRSTLTTKKTTDTTAKSPATKPSTLSKPTTASSRMMSSAPKAASARPAVGTVPPKPRPTTLSARTTTTTTTARTLSAPKAPLRATNLTSPKTSTAPKPRPITAPKLPRVPLTKTVTKGPDAEKQIKESANKLTASRTTTTTSRTLGSVTSRTTTIRKTETKTTGPKTTLTKTSTTTLKSSTAAGKKPAEITRHAVSKTKPNKIEAPKQNGVSTTVVTEQVTIVNTLNENISEPPSELVKDNSPVDNKLLNDNTLIQPITAD